MQGFAPALLPLLAAALDARAVGARQWHCWRLRGVIRTIFHCPGRIDRKLLIRCSPIGCPKHLEYHQESKANTPFNRSSGGCSGARHEIAAATERGKLVLYLEAGTQD